MVDKYGPEIESDLRETYGVDLVDVWRGRVSARHALALVNQLGEGARTTAAIRGGAQFRGWTHERYLATLQTNILQGVAWILANQGAKPSQQSKRPTMLGTPDHPAQDANTGSGNTLAGFVRGAFAAAARHRAAAARSVNDDTN